LEQSSKKQGATKMKIDWTYGKFGKKFNLHKTDLNIFPPDLCGIIWISHSQSEGGFIGLEAGLIKEYLTAAQKQFPLDSSGKEYYFVYSVIPFEDLEKVKRGIKEGLPFEDI
jgi:hypothetical protein